MSSHVTTVAGFVRQQRQQRKLSLGQLSLRSGIHKATLSRWESGAFLPRVPELLKVLDALDASPGTKLECLQLLSTPRAVLAIRDASSDAASSQYLSLGDLLYGLRLRSGKTLQEAARAAGVSYSLYRIWEKDEVRPPADKLHTVAFALGATGEEAVALANRSLSNAPIAMDRDMLIAQYMQLMPWYDGVSEASYTLHLFSLLARLGSLFRQDKADVGDLALIIADMGDSISVWRDDKNAQMQYRQRSLTLAKRSREPLHFHMVSPIFAMHDAKHSPLSFKERMDAMMYWEPRFKSREGRAYFLSFVAKTVAEEAPEQALHLAEEYCTLVADNADEYPCRLRDKGNLLYKCGRVAESVSFISTLKPQDDYRAALQQFEMARGLIHLGAIGEARNCIDMGSSIMNESSPVVLKGKREELEQAFA